MSKSLEEIRASAMKLPVEDRALLSAELAASVAPQIGDEQASAIDGTLLNRIGGPFVPFDPDDDAFWDGIGSDTRTAQDIDGLHGSARRA